MYSRQNPPEYPRGQACKQRKTVSRRAEGSVLFPCPENVYYVIMLTELCHVLCKGNPTVSEEEVKCSAWAALHVNSPRTELGTKRPVPGNGKTSPHYTATQEGPRGTTQAPGQLAPSGADHLTTASRV